MPALPSHATATVTATAALVCLAWLALGAAPALAMPRLVDLPDVLNRTVCPIRVEVDEDPLRVPRRIKVLRCGGDGRLWCEAHGIPRRECCAHTRNHHLMECVEIRDKVLVRYPASGDTKIYDVPVGCTCMVSASRPAQPLSPAG